MQDKFYSIKDLFNLKTNEMEMVFQVVEELDLQQFKYFQIRREYVDTGFSKQEVL